MVTKAAAIMATMFGTLRRQMVGKIGAFSSG